MWISKSFVKDISVTASQGQKATANTSLQPDLYSQRGWCYIKRAKWQDNVSLPAPVSVIKVPETLAQIRWAEGKKRYLGIKYVWAKNKDFQHFKKLDRLSSINYHSLLTKDLYLPVMKQKRFFHTADWWIQPTVILVNKYDKWW